jgi:hypothetical protein
MIEVDYYKRDDGFVIRIHLHNEVERDRLAHVFQRMAERQETSDLAREDGFRFGGIGVFLLGIVDKMRLEGVSVRNKEVNWSKTAEGWIEASGLVNGLTRSSHQILGDGDATIEVEFGAG